MLTVLLIAFAIVGVCAIVHTIGLTFVADWLLDRRTMLRSMGLVGHSVVLICVFAVIVLLHILEAGIWATFYQTWGLFPNFETSFYFSLTSYTTIGYGDVTLPQRWRMLGGVEGFSGVLLCGLSTAFIFIILNAMLESRRGQPVAEEVRKADGG
jgi:voltage-gated potassium channel